MAKRLHIKEEFDYQYFVVGLASDEPIWKLCWQINQDLHLNLEKRELDEFPEDLDGSLAGELIPLLFAPEALEKQSYDYYEDIQTHERLEVALFPNDLLRTPKEARPFRYIFLLRAAGKRLPDMEDFLSKLNGLSFVVSAVDISHIKNINQIIP